MLSQIARAPHASANAIGEGLQLRGAIHFCTVVHLWNQRTIKDHGG